jgi:signal transduction histidine kinase
MTPVVKKWALGVAFWTAVALFFSTQRYFAMGGGEGALEESLRGSLPQWYLWALLSPFVLRADRWARRASSSMKGRLLLHAPLALGFVSAYVPLRTLADNLLGNRDASWSFSGLAPQYHWNFLIYAVLVGAIVAYDADVEARERTLRASQLEARLAEARLSSLKAQLRPHFLFNTLNAISAFMERDPKTARRMMAHLGDLLRRSLESSDQKEVPLAEELSTIEDYVAIQRIRFEGRLEVDSDVESDTLGAAVPSFLLQPLVENAIEHGHPKRIRLGASRRDGSLEISVSDDGVGLKEPPTPSGNGLGLKNTAARLDALYGESARLDIRNGAGGGVTVTVTLPFHEA